MKKMLIAAVAAGLSLTASAEKVDFNKLPEAVRTTIGNSQNGSFKNVERKISGAQTYYEVEFEKQGLNQKMRIAEDGSLMRDTRNNRAAGDGDFLPQHDRVSSMKISEAPQAVQTAINQHANGREAVDIDKETWNGKTVYEVEFAQSGRNAQLYIDENGTIVKDERNQDRNTKRNDTPQNGVGESFFGYYLGTQLDDTPEAAQQTIRREAKGREIVDIDRELRTGKPVYEVQIQQGSDKFEIHVAENGSVVRDSRVNEAAGASLPGKNRDLNKNDRKDLTLDALPVEVQNKIKASGDTSNVKIRQKMRDGRSVYEVEIRQEGRNKVMEIAPDGSVLNTNRE